MRIVIVITLVLFLNDLRSICESNDSVNDGFPSLTNRMQDDLQGSITTLRVSRDADSVSSLDADPASFSAVVLPVEVDLSKWTQTLENRLEELSKRVNDNFKAIESRVKGLTGKFDALENRFTISKRENEKRFDGIQTRFDQFERRINDARIEEETKMDELEKRINQQCACSTSEKDNETITSTDGWIEIQRHNFLDKNAFNSRPWSDYKIGFSNGSNEFWLGLQKMHDQTKEGSWNLKIQVTYDLGRDQKPSPRHGQTGVYEWEHFRVKSEQHHFALGIGKQIQGRDKGLHNINPMSRHNGKPFTTEDKYVKYYQMGCAQDFKGGWWFSHCFDICPNCSRDRAITRKMALLYDGEYDIPSESVMWMKKVD